MVLFHVNELQFPEFGDGYCKERSAGDREGVVAIMKHDAALEVFAGEGCQV